MPAMQGLQHDSSPTGLALTALTRHGLSQRTNNLAGQPEREVRECHTSCAGSLPAACKQRLLSHWVVWAETPVWWLKSCAQIGC